jgi:dihydrofolate reductase
VKANIEEEIRKLKKQSGQDMALLGSGSIVSHFARQGLIDEYRIMVKSIVLGNGKPLFTVISDFN